MEATARSISQELPLPKPAFMKPLASPFGMKWDAGRVSQVRTLEAMNQVSRKLSSDTVGLFLDFEDKDVSGWTLDTAEEFSHFLDIQTPYTPDGDTTSALRIMEATNDGFALAEYVPNIILKAGSRYKVKFFARSTASSTNWDLVTITIASNPTIYKNHPQNGADIGGGWYSFEDEFVLDASWSGRVNFQVSIDASGEQLDWYFDEIDIFSV